MPLTLPHKLGKYKGEAYYRFTVRLTQSGLGRDFWEHQIEADIIAPSAIAACNAIRDEFAPLVEHPTEFECAGPAGGVTPRFVGYEPMIAAQMFACRPDWKQLNLGL
jgi:hypothetical protein